jgi:polyribonucleotide 5'-hydroxyl-kinase
VEMTEQEEKNLEVFHLEKEEELRFEIEYKYKAKIKLIKGKAGKEKIKIKKEIFGTEIGINHTYTLSGTKLAIFTWEGADIQLSGDFKNAYTANSTPMKSYLEVREKHIIELNSYTPIFKIIK